MTSGPALSSTAGGEGQGKQEVISTLPTPPNGRLKFGTRCEMCTPIKTSPSIRPWDSYIMLSGLDTGPILPSAAVGEEQDQIFHSYAPGPPFLACSMWQKVRLKAMGLSTPPHDRPSLAYAGPVHPYPCQQRQLYCDALGRYRSCSP